MATKPVTPPPQWATSGGALITDPAGKAVTGWQVGDKPPAHYLNFWQNLVGQWQEYFEDITDEHQSVLDFTVSRVANDIITATKALGPFGNIEAYNTKDFDEYMLHDTRPADGIQFNLFSEFDSTVSGATVRMYSGAGGIFITSNCYYSDNTGLGEWTQDIAASSSALFLSGGNIFCYFRSSGASTWTHATGWTHIDTMTMGANGLSVLAEKVRVSKSVERAATSVAKDELSISKMIRAFGTLQAASAGAWQLVNGLNLDSGSVSVSSTAITIDYASAISITNVTPCIVPMISRGDMKCYASINSNTSLTLRIADSDGVAVTHYSLVHDMFSCVL